MSPREALTTNRQLLAGLTLVALVLAVVSCADPRQTGFSGELPQDPDSFERYTYMSEHGSVDYMLYVPPNPAPGRPLIMFIPGALATAEQTAHDTKFNEIAAREGFIVLYPEANLEDDGYFHPTEDAHQHRDRGEPAILAGMTLKIVADWQIDRGRILVGGISNGGGMANVMVTTYPDIYAAPFAHSGCAYAGGCNAGFGSTVPPEESANAIREEMGARARVMPFLVFQGTNDSAVPQDLSDKTVASWLQANDFADDGADNGSIPREPARIVNDTVPGGHNYSVSYYADGRGCPMGEYWLVEGMRHAYSGGAPNTPQGIAINPEAERPISPAGTDPAGPSASEQAYRFLLTYPQGCR